MARVAHRYQEHQRRTWWWSSPTSPLLVWKHSWTVQRVPATRTSTASSTARGVEQREKAGALVAADHAPVLACLPGGGRAVVVQAQERPVVQAVAFGARAARDLLPCPRWDPGEQGVGTVAGAAKADHLVAGHRQHVAHPAGRKSGPQTRVGAVDLVTGDQTGQQPGPATRRTAPASRQVNVYAVACGHRLMFGPHNTRSSTVAALVCSQPAGRPEQPGHDLRLEYYARPEIVQGQQCRDAF
jgi:hypothetical protein